MPELVGASTSARRPGPPPLLCVCGCGLSRHAARAAESDGRKSYYGCRVHPTCTQFRNQAGEIFHAGELKPGMAKP